MSSIRHINIIGPKHWARPQIPQTRVHADLPRFGVNGPVLLYPYKKFKSNHLLASFFGSSATYVQS